MTSGPLTMTGGTFAPGTVAAPSSPAPSVPVPGPGPLTLALPVAAKVALAPRLRAR